jgi:glycosyltransferase involved in cell wall biosynthesis
MKILLLTQVLPYPPDSGPKIKTWSVLRSLAAEHEVTLVSFVRGDQKDDVDAVRRVCAAVHTLPLRRGRLREGWAVLRSLASGRPFVIARDHRRAMCALVERVAATNAFDVVHVDQLNMLQYVPAGWHGAVVFDAHNALWALLRQLWSAAPAGPRKWLLGRDWRLLKRYEGAAVRRCAATLAVSALDRRALEEAAGAPARVSVVPIAIDVAAHALLSRPAQPRHILHIGTMFWPPNVDAVQWFVREVYPLIRERRPDALFDVVGARPPHSISALARPGSGINVTGYVADPTPYLRRAGAFIVPLRAGSGMRVKILDALAHGLPVVTTAAGCAGIDVEPGRDLLVADTPADFAAAVLRVLGDVRLAGELGTNGRSFVEANHDDRIVCRRIAGVYEQALRRSPAEPAGGSGHAAGGTAVAS